MSKWTGVSASLASAMLCGLAACDGSPRVVPQPRNERLAVVLFLDENQDGRLVAGEHGRVPGAQVTTAGVAGSTAVGDGRVVLSSLPAGSTSVTVAAESMPPYHVAPVPISVELPRFEDLELGATLPTGDNQPYRYMAFGDSITEGDGSSDEQGYLPGLASQLRAHFGASELVNAGASGTKSWQGAERIALELERSQPAWVLVHYGTNDWNHCDDVPSCPTIESLRSIVRQARSAHTLPVLATVVPSNTGFLEPDGSTKAPPERNLFVAEQDRRIRALAQEEGVALADLEPAFLAEAAGDLAGLFVDHVHPNDRGYAIMAREFFRALSTPAPGLRADNPLGAATTRLLAAPPRRVGPAFEDD